MNLLRIIRVSGASVSDVERFDFDHATGFPVSALKDSMWSTWRFSVDKDVVGIVLFGILVAMLLLVNPAAAEQKLFGSDPHGWDSATP